MAASLALDRDQVQDFARSYTEAWCSGDPTRVAGHFAPGGTIAINGGAPTEITEVARSFMSTFPDLHLVMDDLVVKDELVEFHWTCVGTNTGPGGTGNRVTSLPLGRPICWRASYRRRSRSRRVRQSPPVRVVHGQVIAEFSYGMIRGDRDEGGMMAPIVNSIEISRRPEDVFTYLTNPSHLPDWQESAVSVRGDSPLAVGSQVIVTRRVGRMERSMTNEVTELNPPKSWSLRGTDGPIRGKVKGTVEPLGDGDRSRVTLALDFEGHGIGKILLPLVVRRQAQAEMPRNMEKLKERLESGA